MTQKTSINIKPCNIGSSEAHNRRSAEYLANIRKEKFYIRTDFMARNEAWVAPELEDTSLSDCYNQIAAMVKEKTGRVMQIKDRERVNKKTGKVTIVRGSTPLKEGVVVIRGDTTMEQLQRFCGVCKQRWGITALQVFIHRDEGHYGTPGDLATWKPNLHAHIVWDWMDHDTGKSRKLDRKAMSEMQTVLAECLDMERGTSKEVTGKKHLERGDYILAKQKQEAEQARTDKEQAEAERRRIKEENKELEQVGKMLDDEIFDKKRLLEAADKENRESIKSGLANLLGKGRYAAIEKENEELRSENERIKRSFPGAVEKEVAKRTGQLSAEKRKAEAGCRALIKERDEAIRQLNEQKASERERTERAVKTATEEKDRLIRLLRGAVESGWYVLTAIADILFKASDMFRRAIQAIILLGTDRHKSVFAPDEAADIKSVMRDYGQTVRQQKAVGEWLCDYAEHRQAFDESKHRQTLKEVGDVAEGAYDWKIENAQQSINR